MDANIRLDHNLISLESEHDVHVMLELSVPAGPENAARLPLRLALVVDRSGSMSGPKLETAKRCARWVASRLGSQDQLALVDFDDSVRLLAPLGAPSHVVAAIPRIAPAGRRTCRVGG